ncbi:MAG: hypothetical protein C0507_22750 [Cyanobacteria bacterium PR.3.49]|jgi:hypothetical protein|nr:hypothetical protein [Cyanobacteria bacterium PR.3.49]
MTKTRFGVNRRTMHSSERRRRGSALSEAGPALFLLCMFAIFPVIDLIYFGVSYYSVVTLNDLQLREASKSPKSLAVSPKGDVIAGIPLRWTNSALGGLARLTNPPLTAVNYKISEVAVYVSVETKVSIEPLLKIPFLAQIPGMGAPVVINIARTKPLENPNDMFR